MAEENLLNEQMRSMLNSMVEGVIVLNTDGKIILVNKAVSVFFAIDEVKSVGYAPIEVIRNHELDSFLRGVLETQRAAETEIEMVTPVESVFRVRANVLGNSDKERKGIIAVLHDITELRKLEKIRSEFTANVSHELKTPLASIKGYVETLIDGAIDDKKNNMKFLRIIGEQVERLDRLINDILELSKIESGRSEITLTEFNITEIYDSIKTIIKPAADKKKIELVMAVAEGFPMIRADKQKMEIHFRALCRILWHVALPVVYL